MKKKKKTASASAPAPAGDDDYWKSAAMAQDSLVVDLLLRLKHSATRPWPGKLVADLAPAGWGVRQPRSGSAAAVSKTKIASECHRRMGRRCSPSTPLSWSGGSGGVDGCETSSLPPNQSPSSRSKISLAGSEVNGGSSSKPRKKKTYAELKLEEDMLLKERMHLNQELAMLGAIIKEHRAENESLKRIKLNLNTQTMKNDPFTAARPSGPKAASSKEGVMKTEEYYLISLALIPGRPSPSSTSCHAESDVIQAQKRSNLMLPDLNMMPSEPESTY